MSETSSRLRAAGVALVVTFLWSTSWVLIRIGLDDDLPPISFAGLRYGVASLVLLAWIGGRRAAVGRIDRRQAAVLVALGVLAYGLTQGAQFVAIDAQPAATTSLLLAMTPLVVVLTSAALLREHPTPGQRVGGLVIIAGAAVYFGGDLGATAIGMAAAIVGLLANAGSALLGRAVNRTQRLSPTVVTVTTMPVGAIVLLVIGLGVEGVPPLTGRSLAIIAWLAVVNTAAAFTWWNHAQRHLTASEIAAINTTMVIQIPVLAWVLLDEPLGGFELLGIGLVAVGVITTTTRRRRSVDAVLQG